jgi:sodium transport system ATP-binding protein
MIRVENVRKRFSGAVAVDGVSFSAADGRVTGLLGPNGAGKTTTLRLACGLMKPDAGTIIVDGVDVAAEPQAAQSRLGVLPDASGLYGRLTAREHIRYFGALRGLRGAELARRVEHWIGVLGLSPVADRRVAGFSHGERTKVALARALVHDPRNVLLDEPTNGLDVASTRAVREVVRGLRREGRCVVFSSHVMQEVSALCDRIVIVAAGRVVADGTAEELLVATGMTSLEDAFMALVGLQ